MDTKHFDHRTRRHFGLAGSALTALVAFHNKDRVALAHAGATHQGCPADAHDRVASEQLTPEMRPSHPTPWKESLMSRRFFRAPALALFAVLLVAGPAFSKVVDGTDGPDILVGTKRADQINGKG